MFRRGWWSFVGGRRPQGFEAPAAFHEGLGPLFASLAQGHAATVFAFERLAGELAHHDAPIHLVAEAQRSAWDSVQHAFLLREMAVRFGSEVAAPRVGFDAHRELFAIALENAVEGCVRETFGALQATHQAQHAQDPHIASVMQVIAEDKTRHAILAWEIAAWLDSQLPESHRRDVRRAQHKAIVALKRELAKDQHEGAMRLAGAASADALGAMFDAARRQIWSEDAEERILQAVAARPGP